MNIPANQIAYRKRIGHIGSKSVIEIGLEGGLRIVGSQASTGKITILGAGSHRAIARFLAKKAEPTLQIDDLEKSEEINPNDIQDLLPFWQEVTNKVKALGW